MINMAGSIDHGCVHPMMKKKIPMSRNKAAIVQLRGSGLDMQPWFTVYIDTCQNNISPDQYHMTILWA